MMINKKQMWSDNPFDQWTEEELLCMEYQGICYGKGGGSAPPPPPATQTVRQSSEFPEELKPFVSDIFSKAQAVQEQRQEEGFRPELTQQLASFTPDQQAAFTGIREQVGQTRPLFEEATNLARSATRAATDPAEVAALMNPFLRNVTDIEKREAQRVADVQEQQLAAQAAQAGAFGGSRAAVLEAERQRNLAQQLGDIEARGRAAAFQDAQARLQNQFAREGAGAAQLSALGAAIPAQTFKELGALSGIGAAEQQQAQRALDIATQQAREEYGFPMQTLQDFQSILRGFPLPATTNISRQTFSPAQPLSTQLLGLGTGLAGLAGAAGAFKKAGGLVGAPVAMKDGGYVKLAGGGGLGQLMQGKLPSNRVRMGKTAYQDVSRIPISPVASMPVNKLTVEEAKKLVGAINSFMYGDGPRLDADISETFAQQPRRPSKLEIASFANRLKQQYGDDIVEKAFELARIPNLEMVAGSEPGSMVAKEISKAGKDTPDVPVPVDQAKNPADLSLLQKAMGTLDDLVTGGDTRGVPSSKKLSSIVSPPPPVDDQAQTVTTNLNLPQLLSGQTLDPGGADALPQPGMLQSLQQRFPLKIPARADRTSSPMVEEIVGSGPQREMPSLDPGGAAPAPDKMRPGLIQRIRSQFPYAGSVSPTLGTIAKDAPPPPPAALPLITQMGAQGLPIEDDTTPTRLPLTEAQIRRGIDTAKRRTTAEELTKNIPDDSSTALDKFSTEQAVDGDLPSEPLVTPDDDDINLAAEAASAQAGADAVRKKAEAAATKAAKPDGGAAADGAVDKGRPSPGATPAQIDYNAQISDIKNRDYSDKVNKMLGDAPTYEKGEEPDFAGRMYLALANAGFALAGAPGTDSFGKAFGDAARVGIKDLTSIFKEKRKVEKELRQERNAQKRADYQDKLQRFNLSEKLRGNDLNMLKTVADIEAKKKSNEISADNAQANMMRAVAQSARADGQELRDSLKDKRDDAGNIRWNDVQARLDLAKKFANKTMSDFLKANVGYDKERAAEIYNLSYNRQKAFLAQEIYGTVLINGKLISNAEVDRRLGIDKLTAPEGKSKPTVDGGSYRVKS